MTDATCSIAEARSLFPGHATSTYLSTCTRGLLPAPAREALHAHLEELATGSTDKAALFAATEATRAAFARLIRCDSDEVTFTKNVSEGLNMVAASLPWRAGDNVVVCLDLEHPNNVYPWLNQRARNGIEVRTVPARNGNIDVTRIIDAIDTHTRVVTLPTVTFAPGFRTDVVTVGRVCRERGVFLLADAVQSVGILDTDVAALKVDGLAVSTQKGLCGLYGMGFLYCRKAWAERLTPASLARFGVDLGEHAHEAATGTPNYALMPGARRFDLGNYNYPAIVVARASLDLLSNVGTQAIDAHVTRLASRLSQDLQALGIDVANPATPTGRGSIVCIGTPDPRAHDRATNPEIAALSDRLSSGGVVHTIRRGMIRLAFHLYNQDSDVERVLELVADAPKRPARSQATVSMLPT